MGRKGEGKLKGNEKGGESTPARPSCLELTARTSVTNYFNRPLKVLTQDVFIRADIAVSYTHLTLPTNREV